MKLIYKHEDRAIVYSVKNLLALNNIDSQIKNEYGQSAGGALGLSNTLLELWLANDQEYDRAKTIIETQIINSPPVNPWVCDKCDEENDGNFQLCWKCQNELAVS